MPCLRVLFLTVWLIAAAVGPLCAHPLGNFTLNHLSMLAVAAQRVDVRYVLDIAEIPAYQAMHAATSDGKMNAAQLRTWARREAAADVSLLQLVDAGTPRPLELDNVRGATRAGAGGLPTLYLTFEAHASLPPQAKFNAKRTLSYRDNTYPGRLGWHDVVVAPATEPTHALTQYPQALVGSPPAITAVDLTLDSNAHAVVRAASPPEAVVGGLTAVSQVRSNQLSDMLGRGTSDWTFVLLTFLVAIALGALHALEPGHGKTLLAITLVGARATVKQATILALALTVAHTLGVLALGVAINFFKGYFVPEAIYPWITLGSGIVIASIGARAVQRQTSQFRASAQVLSHGHGATHHEHANDHVNDPKTDDHGYDRHDRDHHHAHGRHDHRHVHGQAHANSHSIPGSAPLRFGSTVWAAMSGGVAPCPAALVVLLAAVALNQVSYGIFVIVAFSLGLAAALTSIGIAVVNGAGRLQGIPQFERFVRFGPLASAVVISAIGAVMVGQGFAEQSPGVSRIVITALVALAIVGYACTHQFGHRGVETA